jgi:hypothetical protein
MRRNSNIAILIYMNASDLFSPPWEGFGEAFYIPSSN